MSHTTNQLDVELGTRIYRQLLGLPLSYFQVKTLKVMAIEPQMHRRLAEQLAAATLAEFRVRMSIRCIVGRRCITG